MRKVLIASVPLLTLIVIGASFFLLTKQQIANQSLLNVGQAAAFTFKSPIPPHLPGRPFTKITPIVQDPTPTGAHVLPALSAMPTPSPTNAATPIPTVKQSLTPTPVPPTQTPTLVQISPVQQSSSGDSVQAYIMQNINAYRLTQGLSSVSIDSNTCAFARTRAAEISQSFNHDGFSSRISSHTLPYSSYHEITENIAMNSDYTQIVTVWINSPGHAENMRKDTPFVCVEKSGNYYAYEGWKP